MTRLTRAGRENARVTSLYCPYCPQDRGCGHVPNALRANRAYATRLGQRHHTIIPRSHHRACVGICLSSGTRSSPVRILLTASGYHTRPLWSPPVAFSLLSHAPHEHGPIWVVTCSRLFFQRSTERESPRTANTAHHNEKCSCSRSLQEVGPAAVAPPNLALGAVARAIQRPAHRNKEMSANHAQHNTTPHSIFAVNGTRGSPSTQRPIRTSPRTQPTHGRASRSHGTQRRSPPGSTRRRVRSDCSASALYSSQVRSLAASPKAASSASIVITRGSGAAVGAGAESTTCETDRSSLHACPSTHTQRSGAAGTT
jgi:hypothetical protein